MCAEPARHSKRMPGKPGIYIDRLARRLNDSRARRRGKYVAGECCRGAAPNLDYDPE